MCKEHYVPYTMRDYLQTIADKVLRKAASNHFELEIQTQ